MRIAIEALGIHYYGGGRSATLNLLEALFALDKENEYLVFLSQPEASLEAANVEQMIAPTKNRFALRLWAQAVLPRATRTHDLVHFIKNLGVFGVSAPSVVTMYDMTTLVFPEFFPRFDVWYWRYVQGYTLRRAARIIAISENTAHDVARYYGIPRDRMSVTYPAYADHFEPAPPAALEAIRRKYDLPAHYVLCAGRLDRVKNLGQLVRAFARMKQATGYAGKLVFAGEEYRKSPETSIHSLVDTLQLRDEVVFTGPVSDRDLPALFGAADVSVMPSRYEGFGIVALEAMASGSPVIVNRAGALAETVGDAAIVLSGESEEALADAMALLVSQPLLRSEMVRRGYARTACFDWHRSARQTLDVYREVAAR